LALRSQPRHTGNKIEEDESEDEDEDEDEDAELATPKRRAEDVEAATGLSPIHESAED
jgi:hypothetical protein